jgi:ferredoxin
MTFQITILPANRSFDVARDETILPAAIRQGIGLPYGCRDGACGSCKSQLLSGRVIHGAHQIKALSDAEEASGLILTCCACSCPPTRTCNTALGNMWNSSFATARGAATAWPMRHSTWAAHRP